MISGILLAQKVSQIELDFGSLRTISIVNDIGYVGSIFGTRANRRTLVVHISNTRKR